MRPPEPQTHTARARPRAKPARIAQPPASGPIAAAGHGLVGGAALSAFELGLVLLYARELFLSSAELLRFAALTATALPALCAALAALGAAVLMLLARGTREGSPRHVQRVFLLAFASSAPALGLVLWLLTSGRRARGMPGRALLVALGAAVAACTVAFAASILVRARARAPRRLALAAALFACAAAAVALDALVLRRLYLAFHAALAGAALALTLCASAFVPLRLGRRHVLGAALAATACAGLALFSLHALASAPNARFAIREAAPLSGKLLRLLRPPPAPTVRAAPKAKPPEPATAKHAGIDLRGRDVLLITVDALRADRLRAYGGVGLTPAMDALAEESAVFLRAYTPTPHTSYAISSLFTAKFMQPLLSLPETTNEHASLPRLLRRHGYRTAAFYPPAVFYVDGERFGFLRRDHFGFEHVEEVYASADRRVAQLDRYLATAPQGGPIFAWVHLFEPHEPYDPPPAFARGDTPVERYDGEVAAADAAVGLLIERFRRARPGATVVLTADHGEEFGDHGGHHHGTALYDEHVRVPLLWSSPGQVQPRRVTTPVEILDVTTTLLAAVGIPREARMRGDDLSPVLAGETTRAAQHAFASIERARAFTDGRHKLICRDGECQLFDLQADPGERRDLVHELPEVHATLRQALGAFVASLPRHEALALDGGGAFPEALARARLGDDSAGPELVPLLSSERADVRAAAARSLGELGVVSARNVLSRMRTSEADPDVAAEAAVAALRLDDAQARAQVVDLLARSDALARRAALALAARGERSGEAVLVEAAQDATLAEPDRLAAIRALAPPSSPRTRKALVALLDQPRLRPEAARALGRIGDRRAVRALEQALRAEPDPEARRALARALLALGARRPALALTRRLLGTQSSIPDGVALLHEAGALAPPTFAGADLLAAAQVRSGDWQCSEHGCRPLTGAAIALPARGAPRGPARVILRAHVQGISRLLQIDGERHYLNAGAVEIGFEREAARGLIVRVEADQGVWLRAIAVVPVSPAL